MGASTTHEQPRRIERAGIPIWWAEVPGPFWASMMFRVGQADESLATRGITHLVEHLALFPLGRREHEYNGMVDDARTVFFANGEREEVLDFLRRTAASLSALPIDRLQLERQVLRAEGAGPGDVLARMRGHRYGSTGYGLANYQELGLRWLGREQIEGWARGRFTRGNVVIWMTGEPPADFALELPDGPRCAAPDPEPIVVQHPAFLAEGTGGVMLTATAPRSVAMRVIETVAGERLHDRIRRDRGLAYAPYGGYMVLGAETAHLVLASDCHDADAPVVLDELWRTVDELRADGVTDDELERYRRMVLRWIAEPDASRGELDTLATDELMGVEPTRRETWLAELEAMDPRSTASAAEHAARTAIVLGPEGSGAPATVFCPYTVRTPPAIDAPAYAPVVSQPGEPEVLMLDERGITYRSPAGTTTTIEWERCAAAERRPDGSAMLHGREGSWLVLTPIDWHDGDALLDRALSSLEPHLVIPAADAETFQRVERLSAERLAEPQEVGEQLAQLSAALAGDEELLDMAKGVTDGQAALLALTDRRVLWLGPREGVELPLDDITAVRLPRLRLIDGPIEVVGAHTTLSIVVRPMKRARELAAAIEQRAA